MVTKNTFLFIFLFIFLSIRLIGQTKVLDMENCLKENSINPKEYILSLFDNNDVVIIGERDHRDTTQYDLLLDIFSDKKFIDEVGYIYTEVGCINRTEWANQVLKATYENDDEFDKELIELYRELDFNPLWEKYNMYKYLKGIYSINKQLPADKKITIGLTDLAFNWKGMTYKKYQEFNKNIYRKSFSRDSIMAANFIQLYEKQIIETGKKKALLIQSFPHAINVDLNPYGANHKTTGSYIIDKYKNKVKIVVFNSAYLSESNIKLIDNGRWDFAFEKTGCIPVGFDIKNTPLGITEFEEGFGLNFKQRLGIEIKFKDIMDGIIFYKPFYEFKPTFGIPNVVDKDFSKELMRRTIIVQNSFFKRFGLTIIQPFYKKKNANYYNKVRTFQTYDSNSLKKQMNKWIEE